MLKLFRLVPKNGKLISPEQAYAWLCIGYFIVPVVLILLLGVLGPIAVILCWMIAKNLTKKYIRPHINGNIRAWQELWVRLFSLLYLGLWFVFASSPAVIRTLDPKTLRQFYFYQYTALTVILLVFIYVLWGGIRYFYKISRIKPT